jgi:putative zinc finger/helix-turn-helix YgiT family protein
MNATKRTARSKGLCLECGAAMRSSKADFRYPVARAWSITLADAPMKVCTKCGERVVTISKPMALQRTIVRELVQKQGPLVGAELTFLRKRLGFNGVQLAERLGVTAETFSRYETDRNLLPAAPDHVVRMLVASLYLDEGKETFAAIVEKTAKGDRSPLALTVHCDKSGTWRRAAA